MRNGLGWPMSIFFRLRMRKIVRQMVTEVSGGLWPDGLRKKPGCSSAELGEYVQVRSAQLVHPRIDALLKDHPQVSGAVASQLLAAAAAGVQASIKRRLADLSARNRKAA
jgi:hypothetical protein